MLDEDAQPEVGEPLAAARRARRGGPEARWRIGQLLDQRQRGEIGGLPVESPLVVVPRQREPRQNLNA